MFPEAGVKKSPEGVYSQQVAGGAERAKIWWCPNHKGHAGLPRTGGQMRVNVFVLSAGQKWSAPSHSILCVRETPDPFGELLCCRAIDTSVSSLLKLV